MYFHFIKKFTSVPEGRVSFNLYLGGHLRAGDDAVRLRGGQPAQDVLGLELRGAGQQGHIGSDGGQVDDPPLGDLQE